MDANILAGLALVVAEQRLTIEQLRAQVAEANARADAAACPAGQAL